MNLPMSDGKYGAPMGRRETMPGNSEKPVKLQLQRLKWVDGDYDEGGTYWGGGSGDYIWWARGDNEDGEECEVFVRAVTLEEAKQLVLETFPAAVIEVVEESLRDDYVDDDYDDMDDYASDPQFDSEWTDALGKAILERAPERYTVSLIGGDIEVVTKAVNQGIDGHLEACFIEGVDSYKMVPDPYTGRRLACQISPKSLVVLIRRLLESEDDLAAILASSICDTLGIELV